MDNLFMYLFFDAEDTVFDASQYAFFGNNVLEEVELGGLEDEEDDLPVVPFGDEYLLDREEVTFLSPPLSFGFFSLL